MTKLVLLRHGQSVWNLDNRFTGWFDCDLSEEGEKEARAAGMLNHPNCEGGCRCSIHRQDAHATGATAGAAEIIAIASGCSHRDVETAGGRDHGRVDRNRGLRTTVHRRGKGSAIKDDQR